ncbi:MAG: LytTR family DNA-binding domain-containing protein [Bacteroidales bacterium]|nr:LytTR family DNA-binding domain-containing protein [Bacteroidales bacterium]
MKILIIEDEPFARAELIRLMESTGRKFEIAGQIDTVEDSVNWLRTHPHPDLIFLDIQLADGLSFEIFRQVEVTTPVIFTTAYDDYAIRAFQLNSIDYLLKPIRPEALEKALSKLENLQAALSPVKTLTDPAVLENLLKLAGRDYKSRILLKTGDQIRSASMNEVAYFYAEDDVVFAMLKDRNRYIVDYTINQLQGELDPKEFFRITRGYLVRITAIRKVSKYFNSRLAVELDPPREDKILVSRVNVPEFLKWLDR